jgi:hypothetical protein
MVDSLYRYIVRSWVVDLRVAGPLETETYGEMSRSELRMNRGILQMSGILG